TSASASGSRSRRSSSCAPRWAAGSWPPTAPAWCTGTSSPRTSSAPSWKTQHVWKILDFGVSKLRDSSATLTNAAVIGTPGYMSPEQAEGRDADHRSDIFSLGAVAYRALTGRPPFAGDLPHVLFEIVYRDPVQPS